MSSGEVHAAATRRSKAEMVWSLRLKVPDGGTNPFICSILKILRHNLSIYLYI